jgi:hypothetical protein
MSPLTGSGSRVREFGPAGGGKGPPMPTLADRIRRFLSSPRGRQLVTRAQHELRKPENRRRIQQVVSRVRRRG